MKIVLLKSVDNLGQAGEAVEVRRGYFRNFLEPRGMALLANPSNLKLVEQKRKKLEAQVARETGDATAVKGQIDGKQLVFKLRAGDRGQLFGSITSRDVADAIKEQLGLDIERRRIDMGNLKTLGDHPVRVRIYTGVSATVTVTIEKLVVEGEEENEMETLPEPIGSGEFAAEEEEDSRF